MLLEMFLIIFSVIALHSLRYGIYLIIFLMPLYLWRFSIFGIPSTALEMMIYILFLVWVINLRIFPFFVIPAKAGIHCYDKIKLFSQRLILNSVSTKHKIDSRQIFTPPIGESKIFRNDTKTGIKKNAMLNVGIILLFLGVAISTLNSDNPRISLGILKGWFFDPFLFFVVFINVIKTEREMHLSLYSWLASGIAVSLISIFYLLNNDLTFDGRLHAFFLSPNHLAMYLAPTFLIALGFLINKASLNICNTNKKLEIGKLGNEEIENGKLGNWEIGKCLKNKLQITNLIIITISLYFTYSFGAFLGIFTGGLYLMAANKNIFEKNKTKIYLIGLILAVVLSFAFLTSGKLNDILNSNNRSSFHSRLMIWNAAAEIIKDNSLFGIGPGTFQDFYLSYVGRFSEPYLEWAVPQPHNIFLAFYLQTGLIGFIGFILIIFWFFQRRKRYIMSPLGSGINNILYPNIPISNIIISLMIYTLVHGLVDTTYWKNDLALMFWLIIGLMAVTVKMRNEN